MEIKSTNKDMLYTEEKFTDVLFFYRGHFYFVNNSVCYSAIGPDCCIKKNLF